jgi:hypothetical protein
MSSISPAPKARARHPHSLRESAGKDSSRRVTLETVVSVDCGTRRKREMMMLFLAVMRNGMVVSVRDVVTPGSSDEFPPKSGNNNGAFSSGLYTSPHLCAVRERIRINGKPIPEHLFAKFFFEVWERLDAYAGSSATSPSGLSEEHLSQLARHPVYFRFLTLLAFHTFLATKTRLTVLEVGMGGTYDSTNVVPKPLVCGVTALGLDHTFMLGDTIEEIARNKGGIYKKDVKCYSVVQEGGKGEKELREMAEQAKVSVVELSQGVLSVINTSSARAGRFI